jgi:N4-gp56 family major capsid protein
MATTKTSFLGGTGGHVIPPYYADFLRENLYPSLYTRQLGTLVTIPRGTGDKVKIPRWQTPVKTSAFVATVSGSISAVTTNVTEGSVITPGTLCAQSITGAVVQFAGGRGYTDKLILVTRANFIEGALESLVRELALRLEVYSRTNISASATQRLAGPAAGGNSTKVGSTAILAGKNIARIAPYMDSNNVPRWEDETFVAVTHPLAQFDIFADPSATGFVSVARYGERQKIYKGEVGQMYSIRLLFSNAVARILGSAATSATNGLSGTTTGSTAWVFAPDAFYSIELEDGGVEVIHQPPGSGGSTGDAAAQVFYGVVAAPSADQRLMQFQYALTLK